MTDRDLIREMAEALERCKFDSLNMTIADMRSIGAALTAARERLARKDAQPAADSDAIIKAWNKVRREARALAPAGGFADLLGAVENYAAACCAPAAQPAPEPAEPVARVRIMRTGGNAGLAWHGVPTEDAPLLRDGDPLYAAPIPPAKPERLSDADLTNGLHEIGVYEWGPRGEDFLAGIRFAERAHGIGSDGGTGV